MPPIGPVMAPILFMFAILPIGAIFIPFIPPMFMCPIIGDGPMPGGPPMIPPDPGPDMGPLITE